MKDDMWHYPRQELAKQVLSMFESGLSSALVFFAPRRMGKTEFLLKDMQPLAASQDWNVLYFSFLDVGSNAKEAFTLSLANFALEVGAVKQEGLLKRLKKVEGGIIGIRAGFELRDPEQVKVTMKELIEYLTKGSSQTLLLMDEVQVLARDEKNKDFVAALRTVLDIYKDSIKVIFTGSSRQGLRRMFSQSDAPFFHFGQNLPFPELERDFIDHMVSIFNRATGRKLDSEALWNIFLDIDKVPQLLRSLVERLVLYPDLSPEQAKEKLLQEIIEDREYATAWDERSILERLLLKAIIIDEKEFFSKAMRDKLAQYMGLEDLPVSTVQSAIRTLQRRNIIGSLPEKGTYYIDDPNFKSWLERVIAEDGDSV